MKKAIFQAVVVSTVTVWMAGAAPAWAADAVASPACAAKRQAIEAQLAHATARGRTQQAAGLERALAANQAHCTDAQLQAERAKDIEEAQEKVAKRQEELAHARAKGDAKKVADKTAKLEEARAKLQEAQAPLPH